jgi:hypothetical protein
VSETLIPTHFVQAGCPHGSLPSETAGLVVAGEGTHVELYPQSFGVLLAIAGVDYVIYELGLFVTFFGEGIFMLWLLIRGWKIEGSTPRSSLSDRLPEAAAR